MTLFTLGMRMIEPDISPTNGRYEYRVWPRHSLSATSDLHRDWVLALAERRADIYLLGAHGMVDLVKLRDGTQLEIKRRGGDQLGLQFWQLALSQDFPLSVFALNRLAAAFGLPRALPQSAGLSAAHLVAALLWPINKVEARIVEKFRLLFGRGTSTAEITRVKLDNRSWMTVAVEDPDPVTAARMVASLDLAYLPNQSYGDFLRAGLLLNAE